METTKKITAKEVIAQWKELTDEQKAKVNNRGAFNAFTGRYYSGINAFMFGMAGLSGGFVPFHKLYDRVEVDGKKKKQWKYDIKGAKTATVMFVKSIVDKETKESVFGGWGQGRVVALADIREIEGGASIADFKTEGDENAEPEKYTHKTQWKKKKAPAAEKPKETVLPYSDV